MTYTKRLAENILEQLKAADILNVSRRNNVTEEEIQRMIEDIAEEITEPDLSKLKRLGIDPDTLWIFKGAEIMTFTPAIDPDIEYPDSDGKPMADNTEQYEWIVKIKENLEILFATSPNVFIAGDLLWYPVQDKKITGPVAPDRE